MIFQTALLDSLITHRDKTAIACGTSSMTYEELLRSSLRITRYLLDKKTPAGSVVGVAIRDRIGLITAMIGVMNARCVFVPLNDRLPAERIKDMLQDLDPSLLLVAEEGWDHYSAKTIRLEEILPSAEEDMVLSLGHLPNYAPADSLYIYFTSGSTGRPKGIVGRNASLLQFLRWEIAEFGIGEGCRTSQLISPFFDAFLRDVFIPLLAGGSVCLPVEEAGVFTPEQLSGWISSEGITHIHCVPSVFRLINHKDISRADYPALEQVFLSGEKIVPSELSNWYAVFADRIQLNNFYGATETTMIRSFYCIKPADALSARIPIGYPIADTELLVLQPDGRPCNKLMTGDLYIQSEFVSNGYLNNPVLNHQKFTSLKEGTFGKLMSFRTGDKARMLADGRLELLGREDRQVKINGIRIEPDEIEYWLGKMEEVKEAAVVYVSEVEGEGTLIAAIIPADKYRNDAGLQDRIGQLLQLNLPNYMLPSRFVVMERFPLLPNGKLDYNRLQLETAAQEIEAPVNETEEKLLAIWKEILGDKPISTLTTFQRAGGNSLGIMRLISKIYTAYSVRIPLSDLFRNTTIQKQAALVKKLKTDKQLLITKAPVKSAYYPSAAQERIYYHWLLDKDGLAYNMPMAWEIRGEIEHARIEQALEKLIMRHESLRTEFRQEGLRLVQVVKDKFDFHLGMIETGEREISLAITAFMRPFDLGHGPLIRATLISAGPGINVLLADIHHIVCDGISQSILYADFLKLYRGDELQELPIQYKDYAEWEEEYRRSDEYMSYREYWLKSFEGNLPQLALPSTNVDKEGWGSRGGHVNFAVPKERISLLLASLKEKEITTFSGLFSLFYLFLSRLSGQEDMIIGINTSGRMQSDLEMVVGMFVKTLPIRCRYTLDQSFLQLSEKIHSLMIGASARQMYDLADIAGELNRSRAISSSELFDVMLVFQNFNIEDVDAGGVVFSPFQFENNTAKYPITLYVSEDDASFYFKFEYSASFFTRGDIQFLTDEFLQLIEALASNTALDLSALLIDDVDGDSPMNENIEFNL